MQLQSALLPQLRFHNCVLRALCCILCLLLMLPMLTRACVLFHPFSCAAASKGRAHKERHQLTTRKKLGLLEKHKDYVLRAKAFHRKEDEIQALRKKAAFKNPDEFYHKMINTKMVRRF